MADKYYIGDLCYILPNDAYDDIVCSFQYDDGCWHKVGKYRFAFGNTAYGDGIYNDNSGNLYPVDAGIIGILCLKGTGLIKKAQSLMEESCCLVVEFDTEPEVGISDGVFMFEHIVIDTAHEEEDER